MLVRGPDEDGIVGMRLDVLLQILRTFERLAAKVTFMRLQRHVNPNVRGDVVTLDGCYPALRPLTLQVQVIGAFSANMLLADVFI